MSEVQIRVGGRPFTVACQPGEEEFLENAAMLLDAEAETLVDQLGRIPENQMLLMAGLMLADKMAAGGKGGKPVKVKPISDAMMTKLTKLADRAEELAETLEAKAG